MCEEVIYKAGRDGYEQSAVLRENLLVTPRRAWAARVTVLRFVSVSVRLSVSYHILCDYEQRDNKTAIPTGSSLPLHWLHFRKR